MGIDLYIYAEKFEGEHWGCINRIKKNFDYYPDDIFYINAREYIHEEYDIGSNKNFLTVVGNIWNTDNQVNYISDIRGLPKDISASLKETYGGARQSGIDGESWVLWSEILHFLETEKNRNKHSEKKDWYNHFYWEETGFKYLHDLIKSVIPDDAEKLRLVFWYNY